MVVEDDLSQGKHPWAKRDGAEMIEQELKPCPFCGSDGKIGKNFGRVSADCTQCPVSIRSNAYSDAGAEAEVVAAWNTRAESSHEA